MKAIVPIQRNNARMNKAFAEYLEGKTVAIVGRAYMKGLEQGDFIDSHDVVVRFNRVIPYREDYDGRKEMINKHKFKHYAYEWFNYDIKENSFVPEGWHTRLGRKTNVYYNRLRNGNPEWIKQYLDKFYADGGKFICFGLHGMPHIHYATIDALTDIRYLDWEIIIKTTALVGDSPLEGTWAIVDVLSHNVKNAYITGFPCYCNTEDMNPGLEHGRKPYYGDLKFLASLKDTGRVSFDSNMESLFEKYC